METFSDIHAYLNKLLSDTRLNRHAYTLERIRDLMEHLGNPQNSYKIVHIAGTSGKSSTAYFMAELLKATGQKVGLSVSPHVDEINERSQINGRPPTEKKFCAEFSKFTRLVESSGIKPTYFEALTAFAFWEFKRAKVDYAVIEVGMGGLLDATNVISGRDKVCILTDIGQDHVEVLGRETRSIAAQKAGIIRPHSTVFSYDQGDEIMEVIREASRQQQAELHEVWPLKPSELPANLPLFQRRNWYLAWSTFEWIQKRDNLPELSEQDLSKTTSVYIPARMEVLEVNGKTVIIDGSHNSQKLAALVGSIRKQYPKQSIAAMVGFLQTKQAGLHDSLGALLPSLDHMILTDFITDESSKKSVDPLKVVEHCDALGFENWQIVDSPAEAFARLLERDEPVLLVTGSFYLLNHIRPLIMK